ncbi:YihY/virulence factor BrkB family protein [Brevibacterium linens]|uniref:YihY/virulence factor BrkB family protein n=1 Tax=Brevibacterium linens TaxID=1703 RepID=UPI003F8CAC36
MRIVKGALRRLLDDECLDRAAGLSFYALLSAAPAILAMVSLLGVVGEAESTTKAVLSLVHRLSVEAATVIRPFIVELTESSSAGVFVFFVMLLIALLYYVTPNVRRSKFRWVSLGAFVAMFVLLAVSACFVAYINNFSSYNVTYGSIGGSDRRARLGVDGQPLAAPRRRVRRRDRTRAAAAVRR